MSKVYSTGPIENATGVTPSAIISSNIVVGLLNNSNSDSAIVVIKVFSLEADNTPKSLVSTNTVDLNPKSSVFRVISVANLPRFEVEIKVIKEAKIVKEDRVVRDREDVLISVFGQDANGLLVAAQRLVHSELTLIKC